MLFHPKSQLNPRFSTEDIAWAMGSFCALNRKPFDVELLLKQFPPPYTADSFIHAARALGFRIKRMDCASDALSKLNLPCLVVLYEPEAVAEETEINTSAGSVATPRKHHPAIIVQIKDENVILFEVGTNMPKTVTHAEFTARFAGIAFQLALETKGIKDPDRALSDKAAFGFHWFIPELMKHKRIWRDVLIASLIIQLLALGTPLFTQVIIDKVVVHHSQSTLIVIGIGLGVFMVFQPCFPGCANISSCTLATGWMPCWAQRCSITCSSCRRATLSIAPPA